MYTLLIYKINVIEKLKEKGYNTYILRTKKLIGESTLTKIREGKGISWENLDTLCKLLKCQPSAIIQHVEDKEEPTEV